MDTSTIMIGIGAAAWVGGCALGWYVRGRVEADERKTERYVAELLREETREETYKAPTAEEANLDRFITMYAMGYSLEAVGKLTGHSPSHVRNRLLEVGVKMRRRGRPSHKRKNKN